MKPMYCKYCGELIEDGCECERLIEEEKEQFIEDYENSPETHRGWAQEDLIYNSRREQ
jgi:hypothetical protein